MTGASFPDFDQLVQDEQVLCVLLGDERASLWLTNGDSSLPVRHRAKTP